MGRIHDRVMHNLDRVNATKSAREIEPDPKQVKAGASIEAVRRVRESIKNKSPQRFNLTKGTPSISEKNEMVAESGSTRPCPRECGPMVVVGLHGDRAASFCPSCRITEPLAEIYIDD